MSVFHYTIQYKSKFNVFGITILLVQDFLPHHFCVAETDAFCATASEEMLLTNSGESLKHKVFHYS